MTGDQLEALIRRELTAVARAAFNPSQRYVTERMNDATARILKAHGEAALAEYGITADRRAVLARAVPDAVPHFDLEGRPACHKKIFDPVLTLSRRHVKCASCQRTRAFKNGD